MTRAYSEIVQEAEQSVQPIKDPELKRVAFEKILDHLLTQSSSSGKKDEKKSHIPKAKTKRKGGGPQARIEDLIDESFFKKPKSISEVKTELATRGHHIPLTQLSAPLQRLCQKKRLRRNKNPEQIYTYSEW